MPIRRPLVIPAATRIGNSLKLQIGYLGTKQHSEDDEDETAELLRELEKIKKERAEKQALEVTPTVV